MPDTLIQHFNEAAAKAGASTALVWRGTRWSYWDLQTAIAGAAAGLAGRAPARGARVALLLRNSPQYVALYYGVLTAGLVAVPLNAQERASVLARQIEHCETSVLVGSTDHPEWSALSAAAATAGCEVVPIAPRDDDSALEQFLRDLSGPRGTPVPPESHELASIIYTSGTTGRPKGVMLSHGNLATNARAIISYLGITSSDRGLCVLPFHFSYGNSVLHSHLLAGAELVLEDTLAYPHLTVQRLQDEGITGFAGVPSTFALLLGRCNFREFDLSKLRYLTQAGGAMGRPLIERLRAELPAVQLFIMYGQTEATARLTYLPPAQLTSKLGSVGIPVDGIEIDVRLDGRTVPTGEIGEIVARGDSIMQGYWNDAIATHEVLRDGWLRTGDLGHRDADGFLFIDGRSVDMIKVGAFRVSPQEIEEVISAVPGVEEVCAAAMPDDLLGQAVKAVIVRTEGATLDERAVKAHCRQHLAAYKVPKTVEFVSIMPRTASGKIQRFKLAN
ncbi:MAG: acyl--CoA ligase [Steroidobacteraceae bacterium]|nr:acyl--CoA ligase [Steroidobacteraceae bacterium]